MKPKLMINDIEETNKPLEKVLTILYFILLLSGIMVMSLLPLSLIKGTFDIIPFLIGVSIVAYFVMVLTLVIGWFTKDKYHTFIITGQVKK